MVHLQVNFPSFYNVHTVYIQMDQSSFTPIANVLFCEIRTELVQNSSYRGSAHRYNNGAPM